MKLKKTHLIFPAAEGEIKCDPLKQFMCDELQCIEPEQKCNGVTECRNGRDEGIPVCGESHFIRTII